MNLNIVYIKSIKKALDAEIEGPVVNQYKKVIESENPSLNL
jgi:hypothetical protein